jgi:hypothetical protein
LYDRLEPLAGLAHRIVHALTELLLNLGVCQVFCVNDLVLVLGMGCRGRGQFPFPGSAM